MIDAQAGIALPAVAQVVPERIDARVGMQFAQRVGPALLDEARVRGPALRLNERVVVPGCRRVDVDVGRGDVVVAGQHDGDVFAQQAAGVRGEPLEPGELVVELRPRLRIAVGQVDAADEDAADGGLDVARLRVVGIARQGRARDDRLGAARQDGDAVPRALPAPDGGVARLRQGLRPERHRRCTSIPAGRRHPAWRSSASAGGWAGGG